MSSLCEISRSGRQLFWLLVDLLLFRKAKLHCFESKLTPRPTVVQRVLHIFMPDPGLFYHDISWSIIFWCSGGLYIIINMGASQSFNTQFPAEDLQLNYKNYKNDKSSFCVPFVVTGVESFGQFILRILATGHLHLCMESVQLVRTVNV